MTNFGWTLITLGVILAVVGVLALTVPPFWWIGRLPGDVHVEGKHAQFYFPLATCLLVSVILSLVMWLVRSFLR